MPLHLAARLHAFVHGLGRSSEAVEVEALHDRVRAMFFDRGIDSEAGRQRLITILSNAGSRS